jgi:hypothetical protein
VIPKAPFVLRAPLNVKDPTVQLKFKDPALMDWAVILVAELMARAPSRAVPPTAKEKVMSPIPAERVKLFPPSTVLEKMIEFPVAAVEMDVVPAKVTGLAKETVLAAVMELLKLTDPDPD